LQTYSTADLGRGGGARERFCVVSVLQGAKCMDLFVTIFVM
jgi:hypothetical protein